MNDFLRKNKKPKMLEMLKNGKLKYGKLKNLDFGKMKNRNTSLTCMFLPTT